MISYTIIIKKYQAKSNKQYFYSYDTFYYNNQKKVTSNKFTRMISFTIIKKVASNKFIPENY